MLTCTGRTVYEWEQELEEVNMYVPLPQGVRAKDIACSIKSNHLTLGIKGSPPYIDEDFGGSVDTEQSFWTVEDGTLHLQLQKALVGESWLCACKGQGQLDEVEQQRVQQSLMLERFQRENPGFDFSQAEFSGQIPDARQFMGGIDHNRIKK